MDDEDNNYIYYLYRWQVSSLSYSSLTDNFDDNLESVVGSVIQSTGTADFEDGLRAGVLPGGCF